MLTAASGLSEKRFSILFWGLFAAFIVPWVWIQSQSAVHSDLLWLSEALRRVLEGYKMSDFAYETNPPLNLFTYLIPVLLSKWTGMPLHYALFAFTFGMILLSAAVIYAVIKEWPFLNRQDIWILICGFILANTVLTGTQFGERDQFVGLALFPFILIQVAMTFHLPYPKWMKWPVLLTGALLILMKPHHGLIPTLLLAHRMIKQRRWMIMGDADFISLALMTSAYIAFTWFFFNDYATGILPDVVQLYVTLHNTKAAALLSLLYFSILIVLFLLPMIVPSGNSRRDNFMTFLIGCAILSLVPFYVQGMAFFYHLFPAFSFGFSAFGLQTFCIGRKYLQEKWAVLIVLLFLGSGFYLIQPLNPKYPRHSDYADFPLTKMVQRCARQENCSFYMFHPNMGIVHETAYYSGILYASRFPSLWFLPILVEAENEAEKGKDSILPSEKVKKFRKKYSEMVTNDLKNNKPPIALISRDFEIRKIPFDFVTYFSGHGPFRKEWKNYKKTGTMEIRHSDYFTGSPYDNGTIIQYDIYERKNGSSR